MLGGAPSLPSSALAGFDHGGPSDHRRDGRLTNLPSGTGSAKSPISPLDHAHFVIHSENRSFRVPPASRCCDKQDDKCCSRKNETKNRPRCALFPWFDHGIRVRFDKHKHTQKKKNRPRPSQKRTLNTACCTKKPEAGSPSGGLGEAAFAAGSSGEV